jgi:hemoglobin
MVYNELPADATSVARGVRLFVQRMIDEPKLAWAFVDVDEEALHRHALAFVVAALGGPDLYVGRGLRSAHERFALRNEHFDAGVEQLIVALREAGISQGVLDELAIRLEPLRSQIVSA